MWFFIFVFVCNFVTGTQNKSKLVLTLHTKLTKLIGLEIVIYHV